jgi:Na+-transporting NADH:ubiquinone oxidoreductase subunit E
MSFGGMLTGGDDAEPVSEIKTAQIENASEAEDIKKETALIEAVEVSEITQQ